MRKVLVSAIILTVFCMLSGLANAGTFDGWTASVDSGDATITPNVTFTPSDTSLSVQADGSGGGSYAWGQYSNSVQGPYAMVFNVDVSQVSGNVNIGIRQYVGKNSAGNRIQAELYLELWSGDYSISYKIREKNDQNAYVKTLSRGYLGDLDGVWTTGKAVTIGLGLLGSDIYLFTPGNDAYVKIELFETMASYDDSSPFIIVYTDSGSGNSISATISNVSILQ